MRVYLDNWPLCLLCSSNDRRKVLLSPIGGLLNKYEAS